MAVTTVPTSTPTSQPIPAQPGRRLDGYQHRREVPSTPAPGTGVDPHPAWLRRCLTARDRLNAGDYEAEAEGDRLYARFGALRRAIFDTSSSTIEGAAARLFLVVDMLHSGVVYDEDVTACILRDAADLLGLPHSPDWRAPPRLTVVAGGRA